MWNLSDAKRRHSKGTRECPEGSVIAIECKVVMLLDVCNCVAHRVPRDLREPPRDRATSRNAFFTPNHRRCLCQNLTLSFCCYQFLMARRSQAQKSSGAPLLPIELLAEIVRHAPESSYLALCLTSHVFHELVAPRLYNEITIVVRGFTLKQARAQMNKTRKWCRTVLENDNKAALVRNVVLDEPFAR